MAKHSSMKTDNKDDSLNQSNGFSIEELALLVEAEIRGKSKSKVYSIKPLAEASEKDLTFFAPTNKKSYGELLETAKISNAGAILISEYNENISSTQLVVKDPFAALIRISQQLNLKPKQKKGVHPTAVIGDGVSLPEEISIGAYAVIGDGVSIGKNTTIYPHATLYEGVLVGENCTIHSHAVLRENLKVGNFCIIQNGSVVGSDGFGYIPHPERGHLHIPHIGSLELADEVEIGANSAIDRGTLGMTTIGRQTKIDNLVQIGHNNQIGERTLVCGQVGVGGSCEIGSDVVLAGCVGVADHIKIDSKVRTAGMTGVSRNLSHEKSNTNTDYAGLPPVNVADWRRQAACLIKLPSLFKQFRSALKRIEKLEKSA